MAEPAGATAWPLDLNAALAAAQQGQQALQEALGGLGWGAPVHGGPAWPWGRRLAAEMLLMDAGLVRQCLWALASGVLLVLALGLFLAWRRARWPLALGALGLLLATPWPEARLLLAPAVPTSLQRSPTGFSAAAIVRGQALYRQACASCHGLDGRGEGPAAAALPMWPPDLSGTLLWRRLEGELFWRVRHGMGRPGQSPTMPAAPAHWSDRDVWAVLDYLQAEAAGQTLRATGRWAQPVRLPEAPVTCRWRAGVGQGLSGLRGQRLHLALGGAPVREDPRWVSVAPLARGPGGECVVADPAWPQALALLLGGAQAEVLVDGEGWLRAVSRPGQAGWSEDDLVCRSGEPAPAPRPASGDGLERLLARMAAEPVQAVRGGFPH